MALIATPQRHGTQHPQWPLSSPPPPMSMIPFAFPTHTPSQQHTTLARMQIPAPSPAPSVTNSIASNSTLSSIPPHNTRELTREMLIVVLDYFSTLLSTRFDDHPVRLVIHGGACMLLHPDLDKLAAQTSPFLLLPPGFGSYYNAILPQVPQHPFALSQIANPGTPTPTSTDNNTTTTTRPSTPPPDVKRTTTRDVDIIARSFDSEWRQIGITNATELLRECIALTAKKFGLGLDWMNSDPDVALPMALDPTSNTTYDPIHTDALKPNNVARHTVYTSPNGLLQLISVTPFWAVALKLVRFTKSDPGDICLILRNGTNISGTKWTEQVLESWLVTNCWPMGYRDYNPIKLAQLRAKISFVVAMVNVYQDAPKSMGKSSEREREKTPTPTPTMMKHQYLRQPIYPYQIPISYPATLPGFVYNFPPIYHSSPRVEPSLPPLPPPVPPKDSTTTTTPLQAKSPTAFLPRSIADWASSTPVLAFSVPAPAPAAEQDGKHANRRATDAVIPILDVRDRGRSRERRMQTWPLVKDKKGQQKDESRTKQKVVDWLKANSRQTRHRRRDSDMERKETREDDELPVVPLLARSPSPGHSGLRSSPPRDLQDTHGGPLPVIPTITVVDSSSTAGHSAPSEESDSLTITEGEKEPSPWHPYHHHQRASGRDVVKPERPQQPDTYSWIRTTQPPSSVRPPLPLQPISASRPNGEGEAFVPPLPPIIHGDDDGDSSSSESDGLGSNTLLTFPSAMGASSPPLVTTPGPPGFIPFSPGTPTISVIPTIPTVPGIASVYAPPGFPGYPGYATPSGFGGFYPGLPAPYQQQQPQYNQSNQNQNQELHGQAQTQTQTQEQERKRDKDSSSQWRISSWI